jgi:hypothetical protein
VLKANSYPRQFDPEVREQNASEPRLLEVKVSHLNDEESCVVRPALLDYQDLFRKNRRWDDPAYGLREP